MKQRRGRDSRRWLHLRVWDCRGCGRKALQSEDRATNVIWGKMRTLLKRPTASHDGTKHGAARRELLLGGVIDRKYTAVSCSCQESEGQPHFALCVHHLNARFYTSVNVKSENSVQSILPSADLNVHSIKAFERTGSNTSLYGGIF